MATKDAQPTPFLEVFLHGYLKPEMRASLIDLVIPPRKLKKTSMLGVEFSPHPAHLQNANTGRGGAF